VTLGSIITIGGVPIFTELLHRQFLGDRGQAESVFNIIEF